MQQLLLDLHEHRRLHPLMHVSVESVTAAAAVSRHRLKCHRPSPSYEVSASSSSSAGLNASPSLHACPKGSLTPALAGQAAYVLVNMSR